MSIPPADRPDDATLAAELAFGLLEAEERRLAELRERDDAAFAEAVERWREHVVELLGDGAPAEQTPDPAVWQAIAARIDAAPRDELAAMRRSAGRWRAVAAFSALAATLLAVLLVRASAPQEPLAVPPQLVAVLDAGTAPSSAGVIAYDAASRRLTVRLRHLPADRRVPELWLTGADGTPRSLGVVATPADWSPGPPPASAGPIAAGVTLAVSLEPRGGSPTGKPTGPVILSGKLA